ncbi:MAG TPA: TIGR01777 family oxidoreductase [Candidatus Xenobia bacterium]|nr:TIGR01777 family oxidoreductase [Candidatus Xenobia bacterium]
MNIVVSGASGFIGSALVASLRAGGHKVTPLVRYYPRAGEQALYWDPKGGKLEAAGLENRDAVIHLAGEPITGRWSPAKKQRIRDSRVDGTRLIASTLAELHLKPKVLVCASAVGYYGDRGDEVLREESVAGKNFLASTCVEWEAAAQPAADAGIRVVHLRIGVVLHPKGGALKQMLLPFKLGLGGRVGSGKQWWSWIALDDVIGAFEHALTNQSLRGPVNAVAPQAVTNAEFTQTLGRVLSRPTLFPLPAFAARLALGEMADELLLSSARVEPARLIAAGYAFRYPRLEPALRHLLGK